MTAAARGAGGAAPDGSRLDAYAVRLGGGNLLLSSDQALLDVQRALELTLAAARRDGIRPARIVQLIAMLAAERDEARTSGHGTSEVPTRPDLPASVPMHDPIDSAAAAEVLGVTPRRVTALARELEGRHASGRWAFERINVQRYADQRRKAPDRTRRSS